MQLQANQTAEKDALKELRKALGECNAAPLVSTHSDEALIRLLKLHFRPTALAWRYMSVAAVFWFLVFLGALFNVWKLPVWLNGVIFVPALLFNRGMPQIKSDAWLPIQIRLEKAGLPVLLDAYALNIFPLRFSIQAGLARRLMVASRDELEALTPMQRKSLVRFTLAQLRPQWVGYPLVQEPEIRAATLGYLALATLKQRGAEKPDRRGLRPEHTNLRAAIEEYLEAMGRL